VRTGREQSFPFPGKAFEPERVDVVWVDGQPVPGAVELHQVHGLPQP
jgi:hypothetical protein